MKLYPFSAHKHAHDIEFRKNRIANEVHDMEIGLTEWNDVWYERAQELLDNLRDLLSAVLGSCRDGRIAYITGPQIALAKETVLWAAEQRRI